ncbi:MAG: 50S ribosomal protein L30 [Methanomassiliicoccaceae archaeon]|nr:50S ribosomal protein L30 [Methanomassiliicoccaceae archaeon]
MKMAYAVVRVRGQADVNKDIRYTMGLLGLTRVNHCVVLPENPSIDGMLQIVKDYCTWGEIDAETLSAMIKTRGKIIGDKEIDDEYLKEKSEFGSVDELAKAMIENDYRMRELEDAKHVFRLHPPIKGYEGNKRSFRNGGALGYRGEAINDLINRML